MSYKARFISKSTVDLATGAAFSNGLSAATAAKKCNNLKDVIQYYYHAKCRYDGSEIRDKDILKAIQYAYSKKLTKLKRHTAMASAKSGILATGVTMGSVVPGLGNIAGGLAGGIGGSIAVTASWWGARVAKNIYKRVKGTQGANRYQCAYVLISFAFDPKSKNRDYMAAIDTLEIILGKDIGILNSLSTSNPYKTSETIKEISNKIAKRLKSN